MSRGPLHILLTGAASGLGRGLAFSGHLRPVSPPFPEGYWPLSDAPSDPGAWDRSVAAFRSDLRAMQDLVADPATDLFVVRRLLGAWPEEN